MIDPLELTPSCEECGAMFWGVHRPHGGHYPLCARFNATLYVEDLQSEARAWAEEDARDGPSEGLDALSD